MNTNDFKDLDQAWEDERARRLRHIRSAKTRLTVDTVLNALMALASIVAHEAGKKGAAATIGARRVAALDAKREKERRREFFAKLDAEYERNFPGLQSGDVRGRIAAGGRSGLIRDTDIGALVRRFISPTSEQ